MPNDVRSITTALRRAVDRPFDAISARPLSLLVFFASAGLLVYLQTSSLGHFRARAVARAQTVEHPALVVSFVSKVYVRPGDHVESGAPLAELSPYFVNRELERLNVEIEQLIHESKLGSARLLVREERWLTSELRRRPSKPSLERPTEALYAAQLRALQAERSALQGERDHLTILSRAAGRVVRIVAPGSPVSRRTSVAAVTPEYAEEIVAYVSAETDLAWVSPGAPVRIARASTGCDGLAAVLRRGAAVEPVPAQLGDLFRLPVHGTPVYISIPAGCELGVGQVLSVEFPKATL